MTNKKLISGAPAFPDIGSAAWLKEFKAALKCPTFHITPPTKPLDTYREYYTPKQFERVKIARALIGANN